MVEKVGLPKNFIRANRNDLQLNQFLVDLRRNVFDYTTNKTINVAKRKYVAEKLKENFLSIFDPDATFKNDEEVLHQAINLIEMDIKDTEEQLIERERYSLPLFPVPFQICRHREQSPININTSRVIHGAIGPFLLGDNACRRYEMRVSFPSDGTNVRKWPAYMKWR